ncbi:transporter substrate-binding domain-containing protein [Treponema primitia]|uniref:transporter substrate-binding domain-containing protein n=1 Tax=Treponema primitia TaxID=88058 RepID=UPI00025558F2|nr:transporter substrate-binding domain-containing protein [Treponema primitia]
MFSSSKKGLFRQRAAIVAIMLSTAMGLYAGGSKEPGASGNSETKTIIYAATAGMPRPFSYVNADNKLEGHNIELIQAIFARLPQYELRFEVTDFPSIFSGLDSDRYQLGVNNFGMNNERKEKYIFSDPIFKNTDIVAFSPTAKIPSGKIGSFRELAGLTTINATGNNASTILQNYNNANADAQIKLNYTDADLVTQVQDVENGKYDFILLDKPLYDEYVKVYDLKLKAVEITPELLAQITNSPYTYFIIAKGYEKLAGEINTVLRELVKDGTSKAINLKYFGSDYTPD